MPTLPHPRPRQFMYPVPPHFRRTHHLHPNLPQARTTGLIVMIIFPQASTSRIRIITTTMSTMGHRCVFFVSHYGHSFRAEFLIHIHLEPQVPQRRVSSVPSPWARCTRRLSRESPPSPTALLPFPPRRIRDRTSHSNAFYPRIDNARTYANANVDTRPDPGRSLPCPRLLHHTPARRSIRLAGTRATSAATAPSHAIITFPRIPASRVEPRTIHGRTPSSPCIPTCACPHTRNEAIALGIITSTSTVVFPAAAAAAKTLECVPPSNIRARPTHGLTSTLSRTRHRSSPRQGPQRQRRRRGAAPRTAAACALRGGPRRRVSRRAVRKYLQHSLARAQRRAATLANYPAERRHRAAS